MGRICQADGKHFISCSMDMKERSGDFPVIPIQNGVECPADKAVITCADDGAHQLSVRCGSHGQGMFDAGGGF